MIFRRIYDEALAQASYLIGNPCGGDALVVDPRRDIDIYLNAAKAEDLRITAVAETHLHADFVSGARELAERTGATLYLSGEGGETWAYRGLEGLEHVLLRGGDAFTVGHLRVEARHTPGHTPEGLSFLLWNTSAGAQPALVLTGDFVFVGDLGRPDLLEEVVGVRGAAEAGARQLYRSLKTQFLTLPDFVQVWPGHGAGSACGRALGPEVSTTVGFERRSAWWADYLAEGDEAGFVRALLAGQPEVPTYFQRVKRLNQAGPPPMGVFQMPFKLSPYELRDAPGRGALLVDTRDPQAFAAGHFRGSINLPAGNTFATWAGWLLPDDRPLVLLTSAAEVEPLARQLFRIGLDRVEGYYPGLEDHLPAELDVLPQAEVDEARTLWEEGEATFLDVRTAEEYRAGHLPGALNVHAGRVTQALEQLPEDRLVVAYCRTGRRSSIAASALRAAGYMNVINLTEGIQAWQAKRYPVERGEGGAAPADGGPHHSREGGRDISAHLESVPQHGS